MPVKIEVMTAEKKVHSAQPHDSPAGCEIFKKTLLKYPTIEAFSGDGGYNGTSKEFIEKVLERFIDISKKIKNEFAILPKRWIVERTFAWINNFRRASKDFEILTNTAENVVHLAMISITLRKCF